MSSFSTPFRSSRTRALGALVALGVVVALSPAGAVVDPNATTTIFDPASTTTTTTLPAPVVTPPPVLPPPDVPTVPPAPTPVPAGGTTPVVGQPPSTVELIVPDQSTTTTTPPIGVDSGPLTSLPETTLDPNATTTSVLLDANGVPIPPDGFEGVPGVNPADNPALGDASFDDAESEPAPIQPVWVPYGAPIADTSLKAQLSKLSAEQQKLVAEAQARLDIATNKIEIAKESLDELTQKGLASRNQLREYKELKESLLVDMKKRAIRQYTGESAVYLRLILEAKDVNSLRRRADVVSQAQRRDAALVDTYRKLVSDLQAEENAFELIKQQRRAEIAILQEEQAKLEADFEAVAGVLKAIQSPALDGFVFPVQLPASFIDTYGADRMNGTKFFHFHQGVDIFAAANTPLRAVKRGVVTKIGVARLGGNRLWLIDIEQNYYYYAHLSAFAAGLYNGKVVEAGEIIGFVGTTGNAVGTPPHLHFEIHPGGKGPINPTPILQAVKDANLEQFIRAMQPSFPTGVTTALPGAPGVTLAGGATVPTTPNTFPASIAPNLDANGRVINVPTSGVVRNNTIAGVTTARPVPKGNNPVLPAPEVTAKPDSPKGSNAGTSAGTVKDKGTTTLTTVPTTPVTTVTTVVTTQSTTVAPTVVTTAPTSSN